MQTLIEGDGFALLRRAVTAALALLITGLSLSTAVQAGAVLSGSSHSFGMLVAGVGVVAVLVTHLLPAIGKDSRWWVNTMAVVVWLSCLAYVVFGHANVFMAAQQTAAEVRSDAFESTVALQEHLNYRPARSESAVLEDLASVSAGLARLNVAACQENCGGIRARWAHLNGRELALQAELKAVRQWHEQRSRWETQRTQLTEDPVSTRLAQLTGLSAEAVGLIVGLIFSLILEGAGCLCWTLLLRHDAAAHPASVEPRAIAGHGGAVDVHDGHADLTNMDVRSMTYPVTHTVTNLVTTPVTHLVIDPDAVTTLPKDAMTADGSAVTTFKGVRGIPELSRRSVNADSADEPASAVTADSVMSPVHGLAFDKWVTAARAAVAAGEIRCTVADIRRHCQCSQASARAVAKVLKAELPAEQARPDIGASTAMLPAG